MKVLKECVIWTINIEKRKSRAEGRKIPKRFAIANVRFAELVEACKHLGLNFKAENDKKYPRCWWEEAGRIVVEKREPKTQLMIKIASKIAELREEKKRKK